MTLDDNSYEVGLGWPVDLDKEADFIGREALTRAKAEGPKRKPLGIRICLGTNSAASGQGILD